MITRDMVQQQLVMLGEQLGIPVAPYGTVPHKGSLYLAPKGNRRYSPVIASTDNGSYFHPFELGTSYGLRTLYDHLYFARTVLRYQAEKHNG